MKFKKRFTGCLLVLWLFIFSAQSVLGQQTDSLNSFYQQALHQASAVYHQAFGDQKGLYNGGSYNEYPFKFQDGDPYFNMPDVTRGTVLYDGVQYDSVLMRYNEITDELVVNYYAYRIQLLKPKIENFYLFNTNFIQITKDSSSKNLVGSGFYQLLYNGKISLLKKEIKSIQQNTSTGVDLQNFVDEKDYYYIKREGTYYPVKHKKSFFAVLNDKKREVKEFMRSNGLNFKRDRERTISKTVAYYDSLIK